MKPTAIGRNGIKHLALALALALGAGLGAGSAQAQAILDIGGAGTIGVTTLTTAKVPAAGVNWTAAGGEGFKNSDLISPPVTVTTTGPVTLKFTHRYFFEAAWDGGAVLVSVNDGPATYLPGTAFSANGYVGNTLANDGSAWPGGENVFYDKSAGSPALIESVANLGTLNAGDTVSVQFRGRWDGGYAEPAPNWEMGTVRISDAGGVLLNANFTADGTAGFTVASDAGLAGPWVYLKPTSVFEINANAAPPLTADRYAPTAPGTNIDLNGANIKVVLLAGTPDPGEVFTLFDLSGGTTLSGTPGTISLPRGTWDASNLAVNGTIVCVEPVLPPTPPPVTAGMMVWLTADGVDPTDLTQVDGAGKVQQWNDLSGNSRNATNATASQRPAYIASAMNGKPALRFTEANSSKLLLGDLSASFWATPPVDSAVNSGTEGAALNGTYANIPTRGTPGALAGDSDAAVTLNGSTQSVSIPYSAQLNTTVFSAEIWAKPATTLAANGAQAILSSGEPVAAARKGWVVYCFGTATGNIWSFRPYAANGTNTVNGTANGIDSPVGTADAGNWCHVVVVNDGTDCKIYVNGALQNTYTPTTTPYVPGGAGSGTTIGSRFGAGNQFNGSLDECAFYTTALSPAEILAHYNNGLDAGRTTPYATLVGASNPVAHYRLNEPTAPVAAASVFAVAAPNNDGRYNLFGNRNNDDRWVANTWTESSPGSFRTTRAAFGAAGYALWPQSGSHVFSMESGPSQYRFVIDGNQNPTLSTTGNYNSGAGVSWTIGDSAAGNDQRLNGDIAELILFNRVLTPLEASQVGGYLAQKYGLTTTYPPLGLTVKLTTPIDNLAYPSGTAIEASATVAAGSVSGGTPPYTVEFWVDDVSMGNATTEDPYTLNLGALASGSHTIYAKVTDSTTPTRITATSATHAFTVSPAMGTTTTLTSSANPSTYGAATVTAIVVAADSSALTGGTVQFYDGVDALGSPVAINTGTGEASYVINKFPVGTYAITAEYSGHGVYSTSSALALSQVVEKAPLTVTANNFFRPTGTANPEPLPYKITGYQNGQTRATSGIFGEPLLTTTATSASPVGDYAITSALGDLESDNYSFTLVNATLTVAEVPDTFGVNFFVGPEWPYGGLGEVGNVEAKEALKVAPGMPAGFGDWFTSGWQNYLVPWAPTAPQSPVTVTSNRGSTATFRLEDCRNGWTYSGVARTTLVGDGNGNMMDAHVNSTLDPDSGVSNSFKMQMSNIPFAVYDVIFYMGANQAQFGDGKGAIVFNGGPERDFTLKSGAFNGTFTEMVDATTPGNYIVFKGVTGSSFTTQTYGKGGGTGFNHLGPFGFQIRPAAAGYGTWAQGPFAGPLGNTSPSLDFDGGGLATGIEWVVGGDPTVGSDDAGRTPTFNNSDPNNFVFTYKRRDAAQADPKTTIEVQHSTDLSAGSWTTAANGVNGVSIDASGVPEAGFHTVVVSIPKALAAGGKLFARLKTVVAP